MPAKRASYGFVDTVVRQERNDLLTCTEEPLSISVPTETPHFEIKLKVVALDMLPANLTLSRGL
jgi:hypothetical protein